MKLVKQKDVLSISAVGVQVVTATKKLELDMIPTDLEWDHVVTVKQACGSGPISEHHPEELFQPRWLMAVRLPYASGEGEDKA